MRILWSEAELDVLFSDVVMPGGMNGVELAKQAVAQRPRLKVLLTSGFAGESLDEWLSQGAWPFLRKPFLSTELAQALANLDPGAARRFAGRAAFSTTLTCEKIRRQSVAIDRRSLVAAPEKAWNSTVYRHKRK